LDDTLELRWLDMRGESEVDPGNNEPGREVLELRNNIFGKLRHLEAGV
jgi:hypothetical protein